MEKSSKEYWLSQAAPEPDLSSGRDYRPQPHSADLDLRTVRATVKSPFFHHLWNLPMQSIRHSLLRKIRMLILTLGGFSTLPEAMQADDSPKCLQETATRFHVEVVYTKTNFPVKTSFGQITGADANVLALNKYAALFCREFHVYPPSLIERARLKRIVLCTDLAFAGQRRNAIPDFEHDTLYLEVERGSESLDYLRKVIHHEFFHIIDYRDDGIVYGDERWNALNPPGFSYGSGGINAQETPTTSVLTTEYPGFLNHYSTTGVEEDKAEVFANLIAAPDVMRMREKADPVLAEKIRTMKELLLKFCPEMNDEFWTKFVTELD